MKCINCNHEVDGRNKFCSNCGKELKKESFCQNCGNKLEGNPEFCSECGYHIRNNKTLNFKFDFTSKRDFCTGAIVWIIIVLITLFYNTLSNFEYGLYFYAILGVACFTLYLLLLTTKNHNYFLGIIGIVFLIFVTNLYYKVNFFNAICGLLNPLVTAVLISIPKK